VWIFNGLPAQWWEEIPSETRDHIQKKLDGFPLIGTFIVDYDPETVGLLSNLCAWQVFQAEEDIRSLLEIKHRQGEDWSLCCSGWIGRFSGRGGSACEGRR